MPEVNNDKNLFRTIAGQIAMNLDKNEDGVRDGQIEKSVWEDFWSKEAGSKMENAKKSLGKYEKNQIKDKQTITVQEAASLIMTRLHNAAKSLGAKDVATKATELGNQLFETMKGKLYKAKDGVTDTTINKANTKEVKTENQNEQSSGANNVLEAINQLTYGNNAEASNGVVDGKEATIYTYKDKQNVEKKVIVDDKGTIIPLTKVTTDDGSEKYVSADKLNESIRTYSLPDGVYCKYDENEDLKFYEEGSDEEIPADKVKDYIKEESQQQVAAKQQENSPQKTREEAVKNFESAHNDIKPQPKRKINGKEQEYYKYDDNGKTVRSLIDEKGNEQKLVVINDSIVTNKQFATMDKVKEAFGDKAKELPEDFKLPSGIEGKFDKGGKLVFYDAMSGKQVSAQEVAKEIKSTAAKNDEKAKAKDVKQKAVETAKKYYQNNAKDGIVDVSERVVNGKKQYYASYTDKNSGKIVRKTLNNSKEELVTIKGGGVGLKGKRELVTLSELRKAAEEEKIENADTLTDVPKGYKCIWDGNNGIKLIKKGDDENKADEK